ncbi:MAG TPA: ABC transporter permease [Anaerolineales bacterium]|nr:ABC transporter permease [Anaerolineales bacterium]
MPKSLLIALKDLTLAFRDVGGLLLMLLAPFALTVGIGLVTGRFSGDSSTGLSQIPVVLVNNDDGDLGRVLVETFASADLADLLEPKTVTDEAAARAAIDADEAAAAVIVPAGFSTAIFEAVADAPSIELVLNPERPVSAGVVQSIVESLLSRIEVGRVSGQVAVEQLLQTGRITPDQAEAIGREFGEQQAGTAGSAITIRRVDVSGRAAEAFDVLTIIAPGFALMFLMFTVTNAGRTIIQERLNGTLPRLLAAPIGAGEVLGGKLLGIFLIGVAQVAILILANGALFGVDWGEPVAVIALVLASAAGAAGWGALLAALAQSPAQISGLGSALMLIFGILGGSLGNQIALPDMLLPVAWLTPNYWGIQGFAALGTGASLAEIAPDLGALLAMAAALFGVAIVAFRRRGLV